jgi:energy-coupling factor transporter transmembrane protein EcfT
MSAVPAAILLAAAAVAALLAERTAFLAVLVGVLLAVCLRAPARRRWPYLVGALATGAGIVLLSPLLWSSGAGTLLWEGPTIPVLGVLDVSTDELVEAMRSGLRLTAVALAFSAYALLLDHDRLLAAAGFARRSVLAVALATRLVPTLERDAAGLAEAVRGRGLELSGVRGYAGLLSPLVAGSLERATSLAEAMEARGYGRPGATRAPAPGWTWIDHAGLALAAALVVGGAVWL